MIPEGRNPAYAQLLVDVDLQTRDRVMAELYPWLREHFPDAEPRVRPLALGVPVRYPVILRIQGPDRERLRALAEDAKALLRADPRVRSVRDDWRQRTPQPRIEVDQERARRANLSSAAITEILQAGLSGAPVGTLHERNKHIPVLWRFPLDERTDPARVVPLLQVAQVELAWDDAMIWRRDRERAISVQADLQPGATAHDLIRDLSSAVQRLALPPGYRAEWDGEAVEARKAQANVLGPDVSVHSSSDSAHSAPGLPRAVFRGQVQLSADHCCPQSGGATDTSIVWLSESSRPAVRFPTHRRVAFSRRRATCHDAHRPLPARSLAGPGAGPWRRSRNGTAPRTGTARD
jgi:hypothetical protein